MYLLFLTGILYTHTSSHSVPHTLAVFARWMQTSVRLVRGSGAWPCSELLVHLWLVGFAGTDVFQAVSEAEIMLIGSQLCLIITAQSKRDLEPSWEVPAGEGRSKSIFISSGVCLSALDPLTVDSQCSPLSSGIPAGAVSSPSSRLVCSREGRARDGLWVRCNAAEVCPVLPPFPLANPGNH